MKKEVSVIIPCKNEEEYLGKTLDSVYSQKGLEKIEVIVAIAPSTTDDTASIAKKYGAKIVKGGLPATARNNGAKKSSFEVILFLDADTYLNRNNFLSKAIENSILES